MKKSEIVDQFIALLGKKRFDYIYFNNGWVDFTIKDKKIYGYTSIDLQFLEKDNCGDKVKFCSVCYDIDSKKWFSENCIDSPEIDFDTYEEMKEHLDSIKDKIIDNGFKLINLP